jgi:hypothetical protein
VRNKCAPKGCLRDVEGDLKQCFVWCAGEFSGARRQMPKKTKGLSGDGAKNMGGEGSKFLGGSDPTLSGFSAAQRYGRRGSLPPKLWSRSPHSVAGRVVREAVGSFASDQHEENNIWL